MQRTKKWGSSLLVVLMTLALFAAMPMAAGAADRTIGTQEYSALDNSDFFISGIKFDDQLVHANVVYCGGDYYEVYCAYKDVTAGYMEELLTLVFGGDSFSDGDDEVAWTHSAGGSGAIHLDGYKLLLDDVAEVDPADVLTFGLDGEVITVKFYLFAFLRVNGASDGTYELESTARCDGGTGVAVTGGTSDTGWWYCQEGAGAASWPGDEAIITYTADTGYTLTSLTVKDAAGNDITDGVTIDLTAGTVEILFLVPIYYIVAATFAESLPETGHYSDMALWLMLGLSSLIAIGVLTLDRKRKENRF